MNITVNGVKKEVSAADLDKLLIELEIKTAGIALLHNGNMIRKEERPSVAVRDGDIIEIIRFLGGG